MAIRKKAVVVVLAGGLSACAPTVYGTFSNDKDLYTGKATQSILERGAGDISIANNKGRVCNGTYHYLNSDISLRLISVVGIAAVRCNDGVTANMRFRAISKFKGWGVGKASTGEKVAFTFGMDEGEARTYLDLPESSLEEDADKENGGNTSRTADNQSNTKNPTELGLGTGFFISPQGHIMTNNHVVDGCEYMQVTLPDGSQQRGETLFTDAYNDLAVIKVNYNPKNIATFPVSSNYRVGDDVLAFGFGLGYILSSSGILTTGTIGALSGIADDSRFMQITAIIQHGNSGGPLSDKMGNVIGINTQGIDSVDFYKRHGVASEPANFAVKEMVMKTFLKAHTIPYTEVNKTQPIPTADLGEQMRLYSVKAHCFGYPKKKTKS